MSVMAMVLALVQRVNSGRWPSVYCCCLVSSVKLALGTLGCLTAEITNAIELSTLLEPEIQYLVQI